MPYSSDAEALKFILSFKQALDKTEFMIEIFSYAESSIKRYHHFYLWLKKRQIASFL